MAQRAPIAEGAFGQHNPNNCAKIVTEFKRQGEPASHAIRFGKIAWRESGCQMVCVHDSDDWGCSIVGNNAGAHGQYASTWIQWCGIDIRKWHTMRQDVTCAIAAHNRMNWRPWGR